MKRKITKLGKNIYVAEDEDEIAVYYDIENQIRTQKNIVTKMKLQYIMILNDILKTKHTKKHSVMEDGI